MIAWPVERAITVQPGWGYLIVLAPHVRDIGPKRIENRTRSMSYRGSIAIHVSLTIDRDQYKAAKEFAGEHGIRLPEPLSLPRGGVIGVAMVTDCIEPWSRKVSEPHPSGADLEWWDMDQNGIVLEDVTHIDLIPCPGSLALPWRLDKDTITAIEKKVRT